MTTRVKTVRFSDQTRRSSYIREPLVLTPLAAAGEGDGQGSSRGKKCRRAKKLTRMQLLKDEKRSLVKELKLTKKGIREDSQKKGSEDYTPYENRQRLARATSEIHTKLKQVDDRILSKEKKKKEKKKKSVTTRVKKTYIRADKQHKRLIKMTGRLERIKIDEEDLRAEIAHDATRQESDDRDSRLGSARSETSVTSSSLNERQLPVIELGKWKRLSTNETLESAQRDTKVEGDLLRPKTVSPTNSVEREVLIERRRSLHDKTLRAEKLASNYEMTRELRNTIHQHMISRSYSFSYFNIIPPYKRPEPKPQKIKQSFNRNVYEDKITVTDFSRRYWEANASGGKRRW